MSKADDWLIGTELPRIFTRHFGLPAEVSARPSPYVAFALAICQEEDIPLSAADIVAICRRLGLPEETED